MRTQVFCVQHLSSCWKCAEFGNQEIDQCWVCNDLVPWACWKTNLSVLYGKSYAEINSHYFAKLFQSDPSFCDSLIVKCYKILHLSARIGPWPHEFHGVHPKETTHPVQASHSSSPSSQQHGSGIKSPNSLVTGQRMNRTNHVSLQPATSIWWWPSDHPIDSPSLDLHGIETGAPYGTIACAEGQRTRNSGATSSVGCCKGFKIPGCQKIDRYKYYPRQMETTSSHVLCWNSGRTLFEK